jgi:hypothetical protein
VHRIALYLSSISYYCTGLVTAIECFRQRDEALRHCATNTNTEGSVLHDLTLAYEDYKYGERPSEKNLFTGTAIVLTRRYPISTCILLHLLTLALNSNHSLTVLLIRVAGEFPVAVHIHVARYDLRDLPHSTDKLSQVHCVRVL